MKKKTIKILLENRTGAEMTDQEVLENFSDILVRKNKVNPSDYTLSIEKRFLEKDNLYFTYELKAEKNA